MKFDGIIFGGHKTAAFLCDHMEELWPRKVLHILQCGDKTCDVMAIDGPDVVKPNLFKECGWADHSFEMLFGLFGKLSQWRQGFEQFSGLITTSCVGFG